jgi:uncharacterized repeat protein (TIGR03803 family)
MDTAGNLYGPVAYGGPNGAGFIYELSAAGKMTLVHAFPANSSDGEVPGDIFLDSSDNLYGLTGTGGTGAGCSPYCGTVFKLAKGGKETIVNLSSAAWGPSALIRDSAGNLYGTTVLGGGTGCGGFGCGTIFKINPAGQLTVLYNFQGGANDGSIPLGSLALDSAGNLYGTTWEGGSTSACPPSGCGTVFKFDTSGQETILHKFSGPDGAAPQGGIVIDSSGNLYGTTTSGGTSPKCMPAGCGTVFKVDTSGTETVLYSFSNGRDGSSPVAGLVLDSSGNLYGLAFYGGYTEGNLCFPSGCGTVFKVTP